jgi:hypothetical protein
VSMRHNRWSNAEKTIYKHRLLVAGATAIAFLHMTVPEFDHFTGWLFNIVWIISDEV